MAVGISNGIGQDTIVQRGSSFLDVRYDVTGTSFDPLVWLINPDLTPVAGVPNWYWKTVGDAVAEQDAAEKAATDAQIVINSRTVVAPLVPARAVNTTILRKFLVNAGFVINTVTAVPDPADPTLSTAVKIELTALPTSEGRAYLQVYMNSYVKGPSYVQPAGRSPNGTIWRMAVTDAGLLSTTVIP